MVVLIWGKETKTVSMLIELRAYGEQIMYLSNQN